MWNFIKEYWAQIALLLVLVAQIGTAYFNYRLRKQEIRLKIRLDLAREFINAYDEMYSKLSVVRYQFMFGSYEKDKMEPILEGFNAVCSRFYSTSRLVKLIFKSDVSDSVPKLNQLLKDSVRYTQLHWESHKLHGKEFGPEVRINFARAIDTIIPKEIPDLAEQINDQLQDRYKPCQLLDDRAMFIFVLSSYNLQLASHLSYRFSRES